MHIASDGAIASREKDNFTMPAPYRIGGAMRCCIAGIPDDDNPIEGTFAPCWYEANGRGMRFVDGAWQAEWPGKEVTR